MRLSGSEAPTAVEPVVEADQSTAIRGRSPRELAMIRFRKDKGSMIAGTVVAVFLLLAIAAPILHKLGILEPYANHPELLDVANGSVPKGNFGGISASHWLGVTPGSGTDVLSRLVLGMTYSISIALLAAILTVLIGTVMGIIAGTSGGWIDAIIGRIIDMTLSFPQTLMLLSLSSTLTMTLENMGVPKGNFARATYLILVLAVFGWPSFARIVRAQVLSLREREFVESAKVLGASRWRIYFKEMLPNLWAPILVYFTLTMPAYISAEAALSFLGVGVKTPTPTLGNTLSDSTNYYDSDLVYFFIPAVVLASVVVSFNLLGDGLRDALDPKADR